MRGRNASESWGEEDADLADLPRGFLRGSILGGAEVARTAGAVRALLPPTLLSVAVTPCKYCGGESVHYDISVGVIDHA